MLLTKYGQSCVRFDDGGRSLVIDPGGFSDLDAALDGVDAILITHEHIDHLQPDRVRAALRDDPQLRLWAPRSVADSLADFGEQIVAVEPGHSFEAVGFSVRTFGGQHAVIHPQIPVTANVCYLINDAVYHPGDSFVVPPVPVQTLLLPAVAPWSKVSEVIDFAVSVRAPRAYPIHDAMVKDVYGMVLRNNLVPIVEPFGVTFTTLDGTVSA